MVFRGRLARSHGKDLRYLRDITREGAVRVQKIAREGKVGGDRGLYTTSAVKQGSLVLSDLPLMSISFGTHLCDHCGGGLPTTGNKRRVSALDGHAT